jgi:DNA-3-methyladenine glycosylase II
MDGVESTSAGAPPMPDRFSLPVRGPFSLDAARDLQCGFLRGSRACATDGAVRMAFPLDGTFAVVGVTLRHEGAAVEGIVEGTHDVGRVARQVARVLGLDQDGAAFQRVLDEDPALRHVAARRPGFRPVVSYSPYVMAGWSVLSQRLRMAQAAAIQIRIAEATGDTVEIEGETIASFPRPASLLQLRAFPGVANEKWTRLQTVARAAAEGELEVERLVSLPYEEGRTRLMRLRGIGPWTADAILMRGCGTTDLLPLAEPLLHAAVARAYELGQENDDERIASIAERWRPFRTWVSVLLISEEFRARESEPRAKRQAPSRARSS